MRGDRWLERWLPLIRERSAGSAVLELGCGTGRDTAALIRAGLRVIAVDLSIASILLAKLRVPKATFYRQNILDPFPIGDASAGVIVASLSLHYFPWPETLNIIDRVRQTLRPRGVLLCRLNSTKDANFGANGHTRIGENFYLVHGKPKRFFHREAVDNLFASGWNRLSLQEVTIDRYLLPKLVWELVLERDA